MPQKNNDRGYGNQSGDDIPAYPAPPHPVHQPSSHLTTSANKENRSPQHALAIIQPERDANDNIIEELHFKLTQLKEQLPVADVAHQPLGINIRNVNAEPSFYFVIANIPQDPHLHPSRQVTTQRIESMHKVLHTIRTLHADAKQSNSSSPSDPRLDQLLANLANLVNSVSHAAPSVEKHTYICAEKHAVGNCPVSEAYELKPPPKATILSMAAAGCCCRHERPVQCRVNPCTILNLSTSLIRRHRIHYRNVNHSQLINLNNTVGNPSNQFFNPTRNKRRPLAGCATLYRGQLLLSILLNLIRLKPR